MDRNDIVAATVGHDHGAMANISDAFASALGHYQAGRLEAAEGICLEILAVDPIHADTLHLVGLNVFRLGRHEEATRYLRQAIALKTTDAGFHSNLGAVLTSQGKLDEAIECCRLAVNLNPNSASAHYNLGNPLQVQGKLQEAIACFQRALELKPDYAEAENNLGNAHLAQGNLNEAATYLRRSLARQPTFPEAHYNLGLALQAGGKLEEATSCFRRAIALRPDNAEFNCKLGKVLYSQGKLGEAVASFQRACELSPNHAEAHNDLGNALWAQGKREAIAAYLQAVKLKPDYVEALSNLGHSLRCDGKVEAAIDCCRRAIELQPDCVLAHNNLGTAFRAQGKLDEAVNSYSMALKLKPEYAETHSNLGSAYQLLGRFHEANMCYAQALGLNPDCVFAHLGKSTLNLLTGNFESGWPEYEWRWKTIVRPHPDFVQPRWDGSSLSQRTILLHAEESHAGLGDTIQFVRYAVLLKQQYAATTVIVECQRPLVKLLASCCSIDRVVAQGDELPSFDVHAPLLSLPGIVKTTLATIPAEMPYLFADQALVSRWREKLKSVRGLRIGIHWRGKLTGERHRDIPLELFKSLTGLPGVRCISLQKGTTPEELAAAGASGPPIVDLGDDFDTTNGAFMDTAAIMMNLDLVITSDTSIPHQAGALGAPVWVVLPFVPDWRWLLDREDSPWYPTMRLFRQKRAGDWSEVFERIGTALREMVLAR